MIGDFDKPLQTTLMQAQMQFLMALNFFCRIDNQPYERSYIMWHDVRLQSTLYKPTVHCKNQVCVHGDLSSSLTSQATVVYVCDNK